MKKKRKKQKYWMVLILVGFMAVSLSVLVVVVQRPQTSEQYAQTTTANVSLMNIQYNPATITVPVGTQVIWTNNDQVIHTTSSNTGLWDSGILSPGQSFSFTFTEAGTYPYHCNIHGAAVMSGMVIVQAAEVPTLTFTPIPTFTLTPTPTHTSTPTPTPTNVPVFSPVPTRIPTPTPTPVVYVPSPGGIGTCPGSLNCPTPTSAVYTTPILVSTVTPTMAVDSGSIVPVTTETVPPGSNGNGSSGRTSTNIISLLLSFIAAIIRFILSLFGR